MESVLLFFESLSAGQKLLWIAICLSFSWIGEGLIPLVKLDYKKWRHAGVNLIFLGTSLTINVLFGLATVGVFLWLESSQFGILYLMNAALWLELLISIMLLDFIAQYLAHVMLHKYKWMWKFHLIHHSDIEVDATTGTRHHPGDYLIREIFALGAIIIGGIPLAFYVFYRISSIFFTYFTHANIRLPGWLDRALSIVFITPDMHKFHHHFERPWTNTNYGNIFSIWDRVFGTLVYDDPRKIRYGLDVLDDRLSGNVGYQFKVPFDPSVKTDY